MKTICLSLLLTLSLLARASGEDHATNINPALRYFQAFIVAHNLPQADRDQLLTNEWRGQTLSDKFGEQVSAYNNEFRLMRVAAHAQVPCDWGFDLREGPALLLPHLSAAKSAAQIMRLRVMWDLQKGRQDDARDDLLATLALARNASRDGTLISVLVQIAMENIIITTIAENFYQFSPDTLQQLETGFEAAPARGTMSEAITKGEFSFYEWILRVVKEAQQKYPGDDNAVLSSVNATFRDTLLGDDEGGHASFVDDLMKTAGGTSEGLIQLIQEMRAEYQRAAQIFRLPRAEYETQIGPFSAEIKNSNNPLISLLFPAFEKCRLKEFAILEHIAMLHAAVEYKLHGNAGFNSVNDPDAGGPFASQRFSFEGVDRGFQLKSTYAGSGIPETFIFVETDGKPFLVAGQKAGEAVTSYRPR